MSYLGHKKCHEAEWREASSLFGIGARRNRPPSPVDQPSDNGNPRTEEEGALTNRPSPHGQPQARATPHTPTAGALTSRYVRPQTMEGEATCAAGMVGGGVEREGVGVSRAAGIIVATEGARGGAGTGEGGVGVVKAVETMGVWAGIARAAETVGGWVEASGIAGIIGEGVEGAGRGRGSGATVTRGGDMGVAGPAGMMRGGVGVSKPAETFGGRVRVTRDKAGVGRGVGVMGAAGMVEGEMGVAGAAGAVGGEGCVSMAAETAGGEVKGKRVTGKMQRKVRRNGAAAKTRKTALKSWAKTQEATCGMVVRRSKHRKHVSFGERTVNLFLYSEREKIERKGAVWMSGSVPPDRLVSRPARLNRNRNRSVIPRGSGQEVSTTSGPNDASPHAEKKPSSTTSTSNYPFMTTDLETGSKPSTTDSKPRSSKHFGAGDSADTRTAPFSASLINPFSKYLKGGGDDNGSAYTCTTPPPFFATSTKPFAENFDEEVSVDLASLPRATAGKFNPFPKRSNSGRDDTGSNTRASRTASNYSNPFSENFKGGDDISSNTRAARTASNSSNPFSENFKGGDDTTTSNTRAARTASSSSNPFSENFKGGDDTSSSNTRAARSASSPSNPFSKNFKGGDDSSSSALTTSPVTPTGGSLIFPVGPRKSGYDGWSSTPPKPGANDSEKNTKSVPAGEGTFPVPRGKYGDNRVSSSRESTPSWCVEEPVRKSKGEWEVEGEGEELPRESLSSYFSNMPRLAGVVAVVGVVATVGLVALRRR
eukprot:jgi/Undpi1/8838/HiC_scaffold_25.g11300.m1